MDMLEWGADWLSDWSKDHASFPVYLVSGNTRAQINATLVDEAGRVIPQEVKTKTEFTRFMFNTGELASTGIAIRRGLRIEWGDNIYEVALNGSQLFTYNDAYKKQTVVDTKHVSD